MRMYSKAGSGADAPASSGKPARSSSARTRETPRRPRVATPETSQRPSPSRYRPPHHATTLFTLSPIPSRVRTLAEVEQCPIALFAFVTADDLRLYLARAIDDERKGLGSPTRSSSIFASIHAKKSGSQISPYLITSASPARSSRAGRLDSVRCRQHQDRLMERTDDFLPPGGYPRLAADGRIHLRQQRGRHLHEGDATLVQAAANLPVTYNTPPSATTVQSRPKRFATRTSRIRATVASVLCDSPSGKTTSTTRRGRRAAERASR